MIKCPHCNKEYSKKGIGTHIWRAHKGGKTSGFSGKTHTKEFREAKANSMKSQWSQGSFDHVDYGKSMRGKKHTDEAREKIAKSMRGNRNGKHRGKTVIAEDGTKFKSTWEHAASLYLNESKILWEYETKTFNITECSSYTPDFYLPEKDMYIEVKGYWREANKQKFNEFLLKYPDVKIEVWDQPKLKELGIIK